MNETMQTLLHRASPRSFKGQHVSRELLDQIVQAGLKAPSGSNRQTPRFLVVTNDECVKKLSQLNAAVMGRDTDPFYGARDVIVCLAKKEGTWIYDGSLAMGNMLNAAYSLGLGGRWIHRAKEVFSSEEGLAILKSLGIEDELEGIGFLIVGETEEEMVPKDIVEGRVYTIE